MGHHRRPDVRPAPFSLSGGGDGPRPGPRRVHHHRGPDLCPVQRHPVDPPVRHQQAPHGGVLQQARPAGDGRPGVPPRDLHRVEVQVVRVVRRAQHPLWGDPWAQSRDGARTEGGEAHAVAPGALHLLLQLPDVLREARQLEAPRDEARHRLTGFLGEAHDLLAGAHRDTRQQLAGPDLLRQPRRPGRRLRRCPKRSTRTTLLAPCAARWKATLAPKAPAPTTTTSASPPLAIASAPPLPRVAASTARPAQTTPGLPRSIWVAWPAILA